MHACIPVASTTIQHLPSCPAHLGEQMLQRCPAFAASAGHRKGVCVTSCKRLRRCDSSRTSARPQASSPLHRVGSSKSQALPCWSASWRSLLTPRRCPFVRAKCTSNQSMLASEQTMQQIVEGLCLAWFAARNRSLLAARCFVETVLACYQNGIAVDTIQVRRTQREHPNDNTMPRPIPARNPMPATMAHHAPLMHNLQYLRRC
jgi:hypothetical protein